jgi:autotransporter adhesin
MALTAQSTAIGQNAAVLAPFGTALGANAVVLASNSVALGQGSIADRPNTVSVGSVGNERQITNVAPGTAGTDAVNVNQLNALGNQFFSIASGLQQQINDNQREARRGTAMALAANGVTTPIRAGGTTVGVTGGFYLGSSAVGVSAAHRFHAMPGLVVFGSYANGGGSANGGKVGASYEF